MAMQMSFTINSDKFKASLDQTRDNYTQAFAVARNMIASMMETQVRADVVGAGKFSGNSVSVEVDGATIRTKIDLPGAELFEKGGTIYGKPLLWLPFSESDAAGIQAKNYGDQLFSVNRATGGVPLLFSIKDREPKYFGVPNVNIPKKFHVEEITHRIGAIIPDIFEAALRNG